MMRTVLEETDKATFQDRLSTLVTGLASSQETRSFYEYFNSYWASKTSKWGYCYRLREGINTNMFVEAFHRVFKYKYLRGKSNRRLDNCLFHLLKYSRDKCFERIIKLAKGKSSKRINMIHGRQSLELSFNRISSTESSTVWKIQSSEGAEKYSVEKIDEECDVQECMLRCHECKICCHMFVCNCPDSLITCHLCKKIYLLHRYLQEKSSNDMVSSNCEFENGQNESYASTELQNAVKMIARSSQEADFERVKTNTNGKLKLMQQALDRSTREDVEAIKQLSAHLTAALSTFQSLVKRKATKISLKGKEPPNKKIAVQRFFSTRKKKKMTKRIRFAKQDRKVMEKINATFTEEMISIKGQQRGGPNIPARNIL
ncbi:uncharacterized protein LOC135689183 [Rhopilema esculentum]|uniref:uncharacterized protein LOC135689183 n=1 Tax=Rhopilema esculentum TaxID=499914 RepID=UPI0031DF41A1